MNNEETELSNGKKVIIAVDEQYGIPSEEQEEMKNMQDAVNEAIEKSKTLREGE